MLQFLKIWLFRLLVSLVITRNTHKPDEWFQGPEVAHQMVFGSGYLTWEWTFQDPLRNPIFPFVFAGPLYLLKLFKLDTPFLVSCVPGLVQSLIAVTYDWLFLRLNQRYNPGCSAGVGLLLNYTNWVVLLYLSRTYVNSLEAMLTLLAFSLWLDRSSTNYKDLMSRIIAIVCFAMRGTSVIFWAIVWPYELILKLRQSTRCGLSFLAKNILTMIFMIVCSLGVSILWYGRLTWTQYNFFKYNVLQGWADKFGTRPLHFYFTLYQAKTFFGGLLFIAYGVWESVRNNKPEEKEEKIRNSEFKELLLIVLSVLAVLSFSKHKELRFILPVIPYLQIFLVRGFLSFPYKFLKCLVFAVSCFFFGFFFVTRSCLYKQGGVEVANYLRDYQPSHTLLHIDSLDVPMYSYAHLQPGSRIDIPDGSFANNPDALTQMQQACNNPQAYLQQYLKESGRPDIIVSMERYKLTLPKQYVLEKKVWHPSPVEWERYLLIHKSVST